MRYLLTIFIICYINGAIAALPDIVLCDGGFPVVVSGDDDNVVFGCQSYIQKKCENGYSQRVVYGFGGLNNGAGCAGGIVFERHGIYIPNIIVDGLCSRGRPFVVSDGTDVEYVYNCQSGVQDNCDSGAIKQDVCNFVPRTSDGACAYNSVSVYVKGSYVKIETTDVVMCDGGYYNGSECVKYTENPDMCPSGYLELSGNVSYHAVLDGMECPSGTRVFGAYDGSVADEKQVMTWSYPYTDTPDNMIALRMCDAGYEMNYLGNCMALCSAPEMRYLRSSTGVAVPVYSKKVTTPSLGMRIEKYDKCYVNMLPESKTDAINIRYNDAIYHTVN